VLLDDPALSLSYKQLLLNLHAIAVLPPVVLFILSAGKGDESDPLRSLTMSPSALREAMGPIGFNEDNLLVQLQRKGVADPSQAASPATNQGSGAAAAGGLQGGGEQPVAVEQPTVVTMSRKQLAMLQSSLPSPNKYKAKKRNAEMGITAGVWGG
jgi:hypothetical protein